MPLSRRHNFISGTVILAEDWIEELDQLYRFFAGTISEIIILNQNSANPVLILQNINGSRNVLLLQRGGIDKVAFLANQQFSSFVTNVAPIAVDSTTKVTNLNASLLDSLPLSSFVLANIAETLFNIPLMIDDFIPNTITFKAPVYIVPAGTNMKIDVVEFSGVIDLVTGSDITLSLKKNGVSLQTITLTTTGGGSFNLNTSLAENDKISFNVDSVNLVEGQMFHNLLCNIRVHQALIT